MPQQLLTSIRKMLRINILFPPSVDFKINAGRMTHTWIPGKLYL
jgi:hypothetical protein